MSFQVLVADDSPYHRNLLSSLLATEGYQVITAADGSEALRLAQQRLPDLLLCDGAMPGLDGFELCLRLKADRRLRSIPVMLLGSTGELAEKLRAYQAGADDFLTKPVSTQEVVWRTRSWLRLKAAEGELVDVERVLEALAAVVEAKDPTTAGHIRRVVSSALALGERAQLTERQLTDLRRGAILHDVGKVAIAAAILLKPKPPTAAEWREIKSHPVVGSQICSALGPGVLAVVRHHHERYDGLGYPDGLAGEAIPLSARIMAVVDAYDAMTSPRPYRPQNLSPQEAQATLRHEAGCQFDPYLVELFLTIV